MHPLPRRACWLFALTALLLVHALAGAQQDVPYHQKDFPPDEFQARRAKVFEQIGDNAIAIVQGAPSVRGFNMPRQNNEFYYLCGIETPHSYIILDGHTKKTILCLPPRDQRLENSEGRIVSADDAELVKRITGADVVWSTKEMTADAIGKLVAGDESPVIYTPAAPAEGTMESRDTLRGANRGIADDPWDARATREVHFANLLRQKFPKAEVKDLSLIIDLLRAVKSEREVALIRRASQLAGLGLMEAMRCTKPGVYEYHLDAAARYVFLVNGARLEGYRSITAGGTDNIFNMHYYRNTAELKDGDLVLMDYAPDYRYYTSDVARMWPVNGKFNPPQRELVGFVLEYRNAILKRIRPGVTASAIQAEAKTSMDEVFARTKFSKPEYEKAARTLVDRGGGVFSHPVGMAVHDNGGYRRGPLVPGHVFSVDPQLRVPEERLYIRYEDVVVVTETGVENFTDFLPSELDDIEKLVGTGGIVQKVPATSGSEGLR